MRKIVKNKIASLELTILKTTKCSDWHLSWGLGTNKLGKLHLLSNGYFIWEGIAQSRHGLVYGYGFILYAQNLVELENTIGHLDVSELKEATQILLS